MKKIVLAAVLVIAMMSAAGCKKDNGGDDNSGGGSLSAAGKLAPPAWIQGSWAREAGGNVLYKFTSDDVLYMGAVSFKTTYHVNYGAVRLTLKETKKTDTLYELTITTNATGVETISNFFSFKKGDGSFIEAGISAENVSIIEEYVKLYKL